MHQAGYRQEVAIRQALIPAYALPVKRERSSRDRRGMFHHTLAKGFTMSATKRVTKAEQKRIDRAEACDKLRAILKPGDTVYTVLRHVSRSGMSRKIDLYKLEADGPVFLTGWAATAMDMKWDRNSGGIVVGGCGMDMGFSLVYDLSRTLFHDSFDCIGEGCPSNDHSNGDRDRTPHKHSDGGYALRHRWM